MKQRTRKILLGWYLSIVIIISGIDSYALLNGLYFGESNRIIAIIEGLFLLGFLLVTVAWLFRLIFRNFDINP